MPTGQLFLSWLLLQVLWGPCPLAVPLSSLQLSMSDPSQLHPIIYSMQLFFEGSFLAARHFSPAKTYRQLFPATFPASTWFPGDIWVSAPNRSLPGLTRPQTPLGQLQPTPDFRHLQVRCSYGCHGFQKPTDTQQPPG